MEHGDEVTYKLKFRLSKATFSTLSGLLTSQGYLRQNATANMQRWQTAAFKRGICLYFMSGASKGDMRAVADAGHIGRSTVSSYLDEFCTGSFKVLKPIYMPSTLPTPAEVAAIRIEFVSRRAVPNIAMAVGGTYLNTRG